MEKGLFLGFFCLTAKSEPRHLIVYDKAQSRSYYGLVTENPIITIYQHTNRV